jgi:hypothetical protein
MCFFIKARVNNLLLKLTRIYSEMQMTSKKSERKVVRQPRVKTGGKAKDSHEDPEMKKIFHQAEAIRNFVEALVVNAKSGGQDEIQTTTKVFKELSSVILDHKNNRSDDSKMTIPLISFDTPMQMENQ